MSRLLMAGLIFVSYVSLTAAQDAEKPKTEESAKSEANPLQKAVSDNPDDITALRTYLVDRLRTLSALSRTNPDAAEKQLKELQAFLKTIEPKEEAGKRLLASAKTVFAGVEQQIVLSRLTMEDITKALEKDPNDVKSVQNYARKLAMEISPIARKEPEKAEKLMKDGQEFLKALEEKTEEKATKAAIQSGLKTLSAYARTIESAKKLLALIGTDAAKLEVEAWVNGEPLKDEELKGKVVLLDFWAVWCGPCVATFPHLIEWDKKYDDLVIIGVTNYYNYTWDAETKKIKRDKKVAPEIEQDMLVEFAKHHKLTHRFALQAERNLSEHYAVSGIPQAVVIDRTGKIRLIRVGSGEDNARDIEQMIEKLIEE